MSSNIVHRMFALVGSSDPESRTACFCLFSFSVRDHLRIRYFKRGKLSPFFETLFGHVKGCSRCFICHVLLSSMLLYMPPLWEATIFHSSLHTVHQFTGGNYRQFFETVVGHSKGAEVFRISCLVGLLVCGEHGRAMGNLCSNLLGFQ